MSLARPVIVALACAAAQPAWGGTDAKSPISAAPSAGDWEFSLSVGPAVRESGTFRFDGGSRSGGIAIPSFVGQDSLTVPPIGDANSYGDRFYNDGFVRQDPSTAVDGYTTYWGYQQSGQVAGDNLSMHATGFQSVRSDSLEQRGPAGAKRDEWDIDPVFEFAGTLRREWSGFRFGFAGTMSFDSFEYDRRWSDFSLLQTREDFRHDWTDVYNLGGVGPQIPAPPYTGTPTGPGFVLENRPDQRDFQSVSIGSENALLTNSVHTRFRADHLTAAFGPTVSRQLDPAWTVNGGIGISLHLIDWSASQSELLDVHQNGTSRRYERWKNESSGTEFLAGVYLQIGAEWTRPAMDWSIKSFLRKDFGAGFSERVGPSEVAYDTDGFTAAVMFSHRL